MDEASARRGPGATPGASMSSGIRSASAWRSMAWAAQPALVEPLAVVGREDRDHGALGCRRLTSATASKTAASARSARSISSS